MCRQVFEECHVFIHTWSLLDTASSQPRRLSSRECLDVVSRKLAPTAVTVETQRAEEHDEDPRLRSWGVLNESLFKIRMNTASMLGGLDLMSRHEEQTGVEYSAAVRIRLDLGSYRWFKKGYDKPLFLSPNGWGNVRHAADQHQRGKVKSRGGVSTCTACRLKSTDFCLWSAPAAALRDMLEELRGNRFDRLVVGGGGLLPCQQRLRNLTTTCRFHPVAFSENVLFCAMHAAGLRFCPHGNDQNLRGRGPILVPAALPAVVWSREAGWRNESSINRAGPFVPRVHRWIKGRFVY